MHLTVANVTVVDAQIFISFGDKIILVRLQFMFLAPWSCYVSQWRLFFIICIGRLRGAKWQGGTNCSSKLEAKTTLESHWPRCRWEDVIRINLQNWDICITMWTTFNWHGIVL